MIKRTYWGGFMPNHIIFNNNCSVARHVKDDPDFKNVGLAVDVFHFSNKHAETDYFCQSKCNPALFPELLGENGKGWFFNTSIAEQTYVWVPFNLPRNVSRYVWFLPGWNDHDEELGNQGKADKPKSQPSMAVVTSGFSLTKHKFVHINN